MREALAVELAAARHGERVELDDDGGRGVGRQDLLGAVEGLLAELLVDEARDVVHRDAHLRDGRAPPLLGFVPDLRPRLGNLWGACFLYILLAELHQVFMTLRRGRFSV